MPARRSAGLCLISTFVRERCLLGDVQAMTNEARQSDVAGEVDQVLYTASKVLVFQGTGCHYSITCFLRCVCS